MLSRHVNCEICAFKWTWQEEVRERNAEQRCPRESFVSTYGRRPQGYWYDKCLPEQMPRSHISIISWLYQNTIKSIQKYSTPVLLWESKLISSDVIKPFAARFANSKMVLHALVLPASKPLASSSYRRHQMQSWRGRGLLWIAEWGSNVNCHITRRGFIPLHWGGGREMVPSGHWIHRKITRAYLRRNLNQTHAINAHWAVSMKNERWGSPRGIAKEAVLSNWKWFANDERPLSSSVQRI